MKMVIKELDLFNLSDQELKDFVCVLPNDIYLIKNVEDNKRKLSDFMSRIGRHKNREDFYFTDPEEVSITRVTNKRINGKKIGLFADLDLCWHCHGQTRKSVPELTLALYCSNPGDNAGGVTGFCNTRKAYYDLPNEVKNQVDNIEIRYDVRAFMGEIPPLHKHDGGYKLQPNDPEYPIFTGKMLNTDGTTSYTSSFEEVWKPLVWEHPNDGKKALQFTPSFIVDWRYKDKTKIDNSKDLWNMLYDHVFSDVYCYYHTWSKGDFIFSDQKASLHNRTEVKGERLLYRFCVDNSNMIEV